MMTDMQLAQYVPIHADLSGRVKSGAKETGTTAEELGGSFNMEYYRGLCHASLCPSLEQLLISTAVKNEGNLAADVSRWRAKDGCGSGIPMYDVANDDRC
jgi:hypothetical protein